MKNIVITYDLRNDKNYLKLEKAINQIGKNERILKSVFLVQTSYSVKQIRDYLMDFVDKDDGIAIFECIHFAVSNLEKSELIRYNWHD